MARKLTPKQRSALLMAYLSDDGVYADPWDGIHPRTAKTLLGRGLLRADEEDAEVYWLTPEAEAALGLDAAREAKPTSALAAVRVAAAALIGAHVEVVGPDEETGPQYDEAEADWSDVVAWVRFDPSPRDEDDAGFEALEKLVGELGFVIEVDLARDGLLAVMVGE
jgi:hypothetical protein